MLLCTCRAVDEYAVPGESEFKVEGLIISIAKFVGIFFGSFVLGCAMGLLTALVSLHCSYTCTTGCIYLHSLLLVVVFLTLFHS